MAKKYHSEVLYNPEDDLHYATLTVRDTLLFALKSRTPDKPSRIPGESRDEYQKTFLTAISKLFWIEHAMGTKVGNEHIRGISGGGLDSSTALEYVQSLRSLADTAHVSTLVALYQASESLFNLFDKVILIEDGKCAFFGRTEDAKEYFERLGFESPPRWTTPDFLTSVSDKNARRIRSGCESRVPRTAEEFQATYRRSDAYKATFADIEDFENELKSQEHERELARRNMTTKNFTIPFWKQVSIFTHRQLLVILGDQAALAGKWGVIIFQALIVGSLFYDLPDTSSGIFTRGDVMFFILLFNALLALAELTAAFESRPILMKHKSFSFYRPAAYALGQVVVDVPLVLIQVVLFNEVVYFMANLARAPSQFFINFLFTFVLTMTMYSFFRAAGALCASLDIATRITGVSIQALIVYTGYLIPPWKMHPWLKWLIWINPVQYTFEALMANEFHDLSIKCEPPYLVPAGPNAKSGHQTCALQGSAPNQVIVQGSDYIKTAYTYSRAHLWRNLGILVAWFIFFVLLTMIGMEIQKSDKGGSSVTVFKRGEVSKSVENAIELIGPPIDEESVEKEVPSPDSTDEGSGRDVQKVAKSASVLTWQNVNYTIPYKNGRRTLLQNTALPNALAQRINYGIITGVFLVDGNHLPKSFQRATGFAEQVDIHEPTATEKYDYCEKVMDLLEMRSIAGATIGYMSSGLNQEQRKRLTIAVELASKPELLLFLDEPTSGLDSLAAFNIIGFLRKLADAEQAILCTIHQPSAVLFEQFDELILLQSGGRVVYNGPLGSDSRTLIKYFETKGGMKCSLHANPAEYMLEVIGAGNPDYKGQDWGDVWEHSQESKNISNQLRDIIGSRRKRQLEAINEDREYAMPLHVQITTVTKRRFIAYWRNPEYIKGKFMLHIITGLSNAFTFWHLGNSSIDMQSRLLSIFMTLTISPPLIQQLQPQYLHSRRLYQSRESNSKIYSWTAFVVSSILPELPYSIVSGSIYFNCWYWGIGFPRDSFTSGYAWMMLMLFECFYVGFGQFIAAFSPNEPFASLLVPAFFTFTTSFCGVVVPYIALPHFWQSWMYWLTPFHYFLEGLLDVVTHNIPIRCVEREEAHFSPPSGLTCEEYAKTYIEASGGYVREAGGGMCAFCQFSTGDEFAASLNVFYTHKWRDYGVFCAYVVFNFIVVFAFSWLYFHGVRNMKRWFSVRKAKHIAHASV
ncbi:hypothetical protein N7478_003151 [Penicillium angulare]|uniref:uncharacterized protein n=1 Tax=Penicillium angulare TaxID=116970 RepID=UPI00254007E4|nr:uncharacterized protein N7478_003151 [Penicillium angulare]KAJ5287465.1 hypothetical protein N7478_003151 [Penicillium angulare]